MRKYTLLFLLLFCAYTSYAQTLTNVSGTITSSDGQTWNNGNITFTFNQNGTTPPYFNDGIPYTPTIIKANFDATGSFTGVMVPDNKHIVPVNTAWGIQVCPQSNSNCYVLTSPIVITGATMDLSLLVRPPAIIVSPIPPASAYQDTEVIATRVGSIYYNLSTSHYRLCIVTVNDVCTVWINICIQGDATCGGGGVVGPGTVNQLSKFISINNVSDSTCSDNGTDPTRCPNGMNTAGGGNWTEWIVGAAGVVGNELACRNLTNRAITCPAGTTQGVLGVAQHTASLGNTVKICFAGKCNPIAANNTTSGNWLIPSASVAGQVDDTGSTTEPIGIQTFLAESSVTAGNSVLVTLLSPDQVNGNGGGGTGNVNPCTIFGSAYYIAPTAITCINPPSSNNFYFIGYNVTGNTTVAPNVYLAGLTTRIVAGTTDTILYSDRANKIKYTSNSAVAVSVQQTNTSFFTGVPVFRTSVIGSGLVTYTPTGGVINGGATFKQSTGQSCTWYSESPDWRVECTGPRAFSFTIGAPGGTALAAASSTTDYIAEIPFGCTIVSYALAIDAGTITVKFWRVAGGTAIPTVAGSINTSGVSISSGTRIQSATLSDFTSTAIAAHDQLAMNVTAAATAAFVNGVLTCAE